MSKYLILIGILSGALWTSAAFLEQQAVNWVAGRGQASGFCNGSSFFCVENLKSASRSEAEKDGRWRCQAQGGVPQGFGASCFDSCFPTILPPDTYQYVTCNSDCSIRCETPDPGENEISE